MASDKQKAANRANSRRSTGPKSVDGKSRVRYNALKHGLTAASVLLPGEDGAALEERLAAWKGDLRPTGPVEDYFAEQAVQASWQLDRANRTIACRLTERMQQGPTDPDDPDREAAEVEALTRDLFWDPRGPVAVYPHPNTGFVNPRISWSKERDELLNPAAIVRRLEALPTGCRWLLDRWAELRHTLRDGRPWQGPDRFRAVRLLGRQPLDALDDECVLAIYLACHAMDPQGPPAFADLAPEMYDDEARIFAERAKGREVAARTPADPAAGRAVLLATVEQAMARLEARLASHRERRAAVPPRSLDLLAFDDSAEGELLRRYQQSRERALFRSIGTLFRVRKENERAGEPIDDPAGPDGPVGIEVPPTPEPMAVAVAVGAGDETKPIDVPAGAADETKPIAVAIGAGDETKPIGIPVGVGDEIKPIEVPAGVGDETKPMAGMAVEDTPAIDAPDSPPPADPEPVAGTGSSGGRRPAGAPRRRSGGPDGDPPSDPVEALASRILAEASPPLLSGLDEPLPTGEAAQLAHLADLDRLLTAALGLGHGHPDPREEVWQIIRRYEALSSGDPDPREPRKPGRARARP